MDPETQRSIDQSKHLLKQIAEDSSVPRNIRRAANEAIIVLEKEADGNVDQATEGCAECEQHDQWSKIEEDPLPHRLWQRRD